MGYLNKSCYFGLKKYTFLSKSKPVSKRFFLNLQKIAIKFSCKPIID